MCLSCSITNPLVPGTGVVGTAFLNQFKNFYRNNKDAITYNVILIARSKKAVISTDYKPLDIDNWESIVNSASQDSLSNDALLYYLIKSPNPVILVDNTSNETLANSYPSFIKNGISIATPNKKAFSSDLKLWNEIFNSKAENNNKRGLVYHEATVGAGLPLIGTINDLIQTGDKVEKIEGILSGTLSYIFNQFSTADDSAEKKPFSEIVKVAKELGYTEPDPRDDLNGLDVARKVTILSRISGNLVESPTSFPVQSLIPKDLESIESSDEFMSKLPNYDDEMATLNNNAFKNGKVLRFVGSADLVNDSVKVSVEEYPFDHPFASLKGSANVISIKTNRYQDPLIIQGAGAGAEVTAAGVLADLIKIGQRL